MAGRCKTTLQFQHGHHAHWKQEVGWSIIINLDGIQKGISLSDLDAKREVKYEDVSVRGDRV